MGLSSGTRWVFAALVLALTVGLSLWRWAEIDPVSARLEGALLDLRYRLRGPLPQPESVVILAVDEPALARIGAYEPLRGALARALLLVAAGEPRVVAIDMLLADETGADAALADAIRSAEPVLLAAAATANSDPQHNRGPAQEAALERSAIPVVIGQVMEQPSMALVLPNEILSGAGVLAHVNISLGPDGAVRGVPLAVPDGTSRLLPSIALAAARYALRAENDAFVYGPGEMVRIGSRSVRADRRGQILDHYGAPGRIETVGLLEVLDRRTDTEAFADRAVFVGSTAPSMRDDFPTPYGSGLTGVELHATAAANLIEGRGLRRDAAALGLTLLLASAASLASFTVLHLRRIGVAVAATLACWASSLAAVQTAFAGAGLWLDGIAVVGGLAVGTAVGGWSRLRRQQKGHDNLAQYFAPSLVGQLSQRARPKFDGREHDAAILFVDVANYSTLVESRTPAEVADFLRQLHGVYQQAAEQHGGVVVDYQGDGALLVFGYPEPSQADAANALACGEMLLARGRQVRVDFLERAVDLRVSAHWGPVAFVVLGSRRHAQVSVTGDAVNVTVRLQEFAKSYRAEFVATRTALHAAGATYGMQPLGCEALRGRQTQLEIWGRIGTAE